MAGQTEHRPLRTGSRPEPLVFGESVKEVEQLRPLGLEQRGYLDGRIGRRRHAHIFAGPHRTRRVSASDRADHESTSPPAVWSQGAALVQRSRRCETPADGEAAELGPLLRWDQRTPSLRAPSTTRPSAAPPTTSRGRWAPTYTRAAATVAARPVSRGRASPSSDSRAAAAMAVATPACPDGNPPPDWVRPRMRRSSTRAAGRGRRTVSFTSLASSHAVAPRTTSLVARRRSPRARAAPAEA